MKRLLFTLIAVVLGMSELFSQEDLHVKSVQYWLDDNHTTAKVSSELDFDVDCSELRSGYHVFHYRIQDSQGKYSQLMEQGFLKSPFQKIASDVAYIEYWWDDRHDDIVLNPYSDESFVLPTDVLRPGLHSLSYRVCDNVGRWTPIQSQYFFKGEVPDSARIVSYSYWWNDMTEKVTVRPLDVPAVSILIDDDLRVPEDAQTNYAGHCTAILNMVITDNHGKISFTSVNVQYPDFNPPVTDIDVDKYVTSSSSVTLKWKDISDDLMGDYNVYVAKDNGPFLLWLPDTEQTTAVFKGEKGSSYIFTVTGRDAAGNREEYNESKCVSVTFE